MIPIFLPLIFFQNFLHYAQDIVYLHISSIAPHITPPLCLLLKAILYMTESYVLVFINRLNFSIPSWLLE